ncbi:hypothetical protein GSY74_05870 [Sulfurovum sp. bin170]|uniref:hypothetical protein n=1 Tax=Sulfurovum sp. bin170 TaxID=2695268 RepID=UPI0013E03C1B|nr:hypothetical protein [Sulfurovum sp. bin170]NEW60804.1 hypothetical protein [Sulfurovum sp. bin170]
MTKKILLATLVVAFTFSGCSMLSDSEPTTDKVAKAAQKAGDAVDGAKKVTDSAKKATTKVDATESDLPQSSMKDQVVEEIVEVADKKTDGAATKVIESVK